MRVRRKLNHAWRLVATAIGFATFGVGSIAISLTAFPIIHLVSCDRSRANRRCQYVVHLAFRLFVWTMRSLGVLTYEIEHAERLRQAKGTLIIANHPSLIDVVFIVSQIPQALCVVKKSAWSNPVLVGVMLATGYIQNDEPFRMIQKCILGLEAGSNLVVFPEATRTVPGRPMRLRRGAAAIIAGRAQPFIPVIVSCQPTTLTKAEKWHQIPHARVHYRLTVGKYVDPRPLIVDGESLSLSNRRINRLILECFSRGIEGHGQQGQSH